MPPTYRRLTSKFTCADLADPFGFGSRAWPAHADAAGPGDRPRPPRLDQR
jgi:hypothetical protein